MGKVCHIISIVNIHANKENIYTSNQGRTQDLGGGSKNLFFGDLEICMSRREIRHALC